MANKDNEPKNAWEYADWLYTSGRLTTEEFSKLKLFLIQLEDETRSAAETCCCNIGC